LTLLEAGYVVDIRGKNPQFCEPVSVGNSWQDFPASPGEELTDFYTDIFSTLVTFLKIISKVSFNKGVRVFFSVFKFYDTFTGLS
jgi:hypothetical protein